MAANITKTYTVASKFLDAKPWVKDLSRFVEELFIEIRGEDIYCHCVVKWRKLDKLACCLELWDDGWNPLFEELWPVLKQYYCPSDEAARSPENMIVTLQENGFTEKGY